MESLEVQKKFGEAKKLEIFELSWMIRNIWRDWYNARKSPRASDTNKTFIQYNGPAFISCIANPLKKKSVELELIYYPLFKRPSTKDIIIRLIILIVKLLGLFFYNTLLLYIFRKKELHNFLIDIISNNTIYNDRRFYNEIRDVFILYYKNLLLSMKKIILDEIRKNIQILLVLQNNIVEQIEHFFLKYWLGCTSAGGIPASTEQHCHSFLAVRLSMLGEHSVHGFVLTASTDYRGRHYARMPLC